ncbi:DUF817 domain-containing protein [Rhodanobacter sp. L36]|uniref:DUF817 domain-containing protein n=1 Tax=Rhodanobacter sp. L36 TaxID=1747221 RepID=UPI00131B99EC|nr:DUF817 domain-containing protein [Rhodanobacter sp. L36]
MLSAIAILARRLRILDRWIACRIRPHGRFAVFVHEFICFGVKQASASLFGGLMVALLLATWRWYPAHAPLARYDFLTLAALAMQLMLLLTRLESLEEAKVILLFHVVGTAMELFKTSVGSWEYPEPSLLRLGGVPLFSGFMYASIGSYLARVWRLFDFRFTRHPPFVVTALLACAIYANFFTHHYLPDVRWLLFAALVWVFGPCWVHFRVRRVHRRMPLLLGFVLVAVFIWFAENVGTLSKAWLYPAQRHGWQMVPLGKLGAWLLLMVISYVMVSAVHHASPARTAR